MTDIDYEIEQLQLELALKESFPMYLEYVYGYIGLPSATKLQDRIAEHLDTDFKRLILEAARGTGKSWIGAIYVTWRIWKNPEEKILIISATGPASYKINTFIRGLFDVVPVLIPLAPGKNDRDSILAFDVSGCKIAIEASISSASITGQITGKRASFILADDIEIPANSMTETMREKLISRIQEFGSLLIPDMPNAVLYLGTPQSMESIYNKIENVETIILPAEVPYNENVYEGKLDPWILLQGNPGTPVDKIRFDRDTLIEKMADVGKSAYQLQFMLDTTLIDELKYPIKLKDMIVYPLNSKEAPMSIYHTTNKSYELDIDNIGFTGDRLYSPLKVSDDYTKYDTIIMSIDPSGRGGDETTYCVLGILNGNVYVLDWGGTTLGYSTEALIFLANKALKYKVNEIVPEDNFGDGMFTELFRKVLNKIYPCTIIDDFKSKGQKEVRIIDNILPLFTNHQIIFNEDTVREEIKWAKQIDSNDKIGNMQYSLIYQLSRITYDKQSLVHDDRLDALAIACQYISHMVVIDAEDMIKQFEEEEFERSLQEFLDMDDKIVSNSYINNI